MRVVLAFAVNTFCNFIIGLVVAKFLGPAEYGRFALALALGIVVQTALFDWLKLSATRFYSARTREVSPQLRSTLDLALALVTCALTLLAIAIALSGVEFQLSGELVTLALGAAVANGLFDYHTAMVRARFMDGEYARLVIVKNIAALFLTAGGAFVFGSAKMALMGVCVALVGSVLSVSASLRDPMTRPGLAQGATARTAASYAFPIVAANVLYQLVPLFNRGHVAGQYGFAESGQFSLAYDIGVRIVAAIGSTLDVLLFQIAVRVDESHGAQVARAQVSRNFSVVLAIVTPACVGLWLTLPSIEAIVVPQEFRGPFARYLALLLPGLFCYAMLFYGLNPVFQIAKRTAPVIFAALIAATLDIVLVLALPRAEDSSLIVLAQGGMFVLAFLVLAGFAIAARTRWPQGRDVGLIGIAALTMAGVLLPLRFWPPGPAVLLLQVLAGTAIYAAFVLWFDISGLRTAVLGQTRLSDR